MYRIRYIRRVDSPGLDERLREVLLAQETDLVAAYLYGSQARGTARLGSDVDIAVLFRTPVAAGPRSRLMDVQRALDATVREEVQLVDLRSAPPDLVHRVLRDGRLLLDRDRSARIAFEVRSRNEYFDLAPTLRRYRGVSEEIEP